MIRGTTTAFALNVIGDDALDLTKASDVYVTISQKDFEVTLSGTELVIFPKQIVCSLTQDKSLQLIKGPAEIQVNWVYRSGSNVDRNATIARQIRIGKQLLDEVL